MATNYALIISTLLDLILQVSKMSGKSREELDVMYDEAKAKFDALPDPSILRDTVGD